MDRPLPKRLWPRIARGLAVTCAVAAVGWGAAQWIGDVSEASLVVARTDLRLDTVRSGPFLPRVYASGTLRPHRSVALQNNVAGRVEEVLVVPGASVRRRDLLFRLSNPETEMTVFSYEVQVAEQMNNLNEREQMLERNWQEDEIELLRLEHDIAEADEEIARRRHLMQSGFERRAEVEALIRKEAYLRKVFTRRRELLSASLAWQTKQLEQARELGAQLVRNLETARKSIAALNIRAQIDGSRLPGWNPTAGRNSR